MQQMQTFGRGRHRRVCYALEGEGDLCGIEFERGRGELRGEKVRGER